MALFDAMAPADRAWMLEQLKTRKGVDMGAVIKELFDEEAARHMISISFADWSGWEEFRLQSGMTLDEDDLAFPDVKITQVDFWSGDEDGRDMRATVTATLKFYCGEIQFDGMHFPFTVKGPEWIAVQQVYELPVDEYPALFGLDD